MNIFMTYQPHNYYYFLKINILVIILKKTRLENQIIQEKLS